MSITMLIVKVEVMVLRPGGFVGKAYWDKEPVYTV